jgi:sulfate adenylyltransferase subunit 2
MEQQYQLDHLDELEAESMFVLREVAAQFERPAILFSGGKDSIVVTHLAAKAFAPARIPMPLVHIDTGHNFPETIEFRDALAERLGVQLVVGQCASHHRRRTSPRRDRSASQSQPTANRHRCWRPLKTANTMRASEVRGGTKRKARAKERFFSHRDDFGPMGSRRIQRPELVELIQWQTHARRKFPRFSAEQLDRTRHLELHHAGTNRTCPAFTTLTSACALFGTA